MSRFIDKLNRVSQAVPQPIGFRTQQPAALKPEMLLVASLTQTDIENLAEYVDGADAWVLRIPKLAGGAKTTEKRLPAVSDIPWGAWLEGDIPEATKQMVKAGCDFVIFPAADTPLALFQGNEPGTILEVDVSLGEGLLRAVNDLPVDAIFIASSKEDQGYFLTWHHLMLFRRFANSLTKPLLASVPSDVTDAELQALWEAGIRGVVTEVKTEQPAKHVKELRDMISKLTPPPPRKRRKAEVMLPYIGGETSRVNREEEE